MRLVVQRVNKAQVLIDHKVFSKINHGLLVLLAIENEDDETDLQWLVKKLIGLRIFSDENGRMNLSIKELGGDLMVVSQFTLFGNVKKGSRPSFTRSAKPELAIPLYESFLKQCELLLGKKPASGKFGGDMKISLENDGPVTLILDSKNKNL